MNDEQRTELARMLARDAKRWLDEMAVAALEDNRATWKGTPFPMAQSPAAAVSFKVGDRVRVKATGQVGAIDDISFEGTFGLRVPGKNFFLFHPAEALELAETPTDPAPAPGVVYACGTCGEPNEYQAGRFTCFTCSRRGY